jgi:hypothetical protein
MAQLWAGIGVWWLWFLLALTLTTPEWFQYLIVTVLSVTVQLLIDPSEWYFGPAIAGVALLAKRIEEVLLVTGDRIRVAVLRDRRR